MNNKTDLIDPGTAKIILRIVIGFSAITFITGIMILVGTVKEAFAAHETDSWPVLLVL